MKLWEGILIYAMGAATGAFLMHRYMDNKYEERFGNDLKEMREFYTSDKFNKSKKEVEVDKDVKVEDNDETVFVDKEGTEYKPVREKVYYDKIAKAYTDEEKFVEKEKDVAEDAEDEEFDEELFDEVEEEDGIVMGHREVLREPHIIDFDEFSKPSCLDKVTFTYYSKDDTMADDNEDIVDDEKYLLGDFGRCFGQESGDPHVVYIRNEKVGCDYEVIWTNDSYAESIGIFDE